MSSFGRRKQEKFTVASGWKFEAWYGVGNRGGAFVSATCSIEFSLKCSQRLPVLMRNTFLRARVNLNTLTLSRL